VLSSGARTGADCNLQTARNFTKSQLVSISVN
jgi:hypothetical protein